VTQVLIDTDTDFDRIVDAHFAAELRGDVDATIATFTDDVEHDVVGSPAVGHGRAEAAVFYRRLFADLHLAEIEKVRRYHGPDFVVDESIVHARATGTPLGFSGDNRNVQFRLLHIFEIRDGAISRETAWLDVAAIARQLAG
jgi:steroid delta-isomerase-like uncharacterized protein